VVYISRIEALNRTWEILASENGVTGVSDRNSDIQGAENAHSALAAEQLRRYFSGERIAFSVPLDLAGTAFQRSVWEVLCRIPYGKAVCYREISDAIGKPMAVRAVGQAIGRNPCLILVPCHRVLGKDRSLTGFSAGLELKRTLLELEKIDYR